MGKKKYDSTRELEMLNSQVRMDGVGEDPVVKDLLSDKFVKGTDMEAGSIALALAELLTGMKATAHQQDVIMKRFDKLERAQRAWETDKKKFLEDVDRRAESLRTSNPIQKDRYAADWAQAAKEAQEQATAQSVVAQLAFEKRLLDEPTEIIMSPGVMEMHREGDQIIPIIVPEIIAIKNKKWSLTPGEAVIVPHIVADEWRRKNKQKAALQERKNLIKDGKTEAHVMKAEWEKINEKYKFSTDIMPMPD